MGESVIRMPVTQADIDEIRHRHSVHVDDGGCLARVLREAQARLDHPAMSVVPGVEVGEIRKVVYKAVATEIPAFARKIDHITQVVTERIYAHLTAQGDVKQVGWCWVEVVSTDPYTCKFQPFERYGDAEMNQLDTKWFTDHKWAPMYIGYTPTPTDGNKVRKAVETAIRVINEQSSFNGCITGTLWADGHTTLVELLESSLGEVRP